MGKTEAEVRKLIERAVELHLRLMREDGDLIPEPTAMSADHVVVPV